MTTDISIEDVATITKFIKKFKAKDENLIEFKILYEIPPMKNFLRSFQQVERIALKLIENEAPWFNVFDILHINHLEAKVHTPFLAELLSPDGTHMQGRLFFDAFMKRLLQGVYEASAVTHINIVTELGDYDNGRMDIVISYKENDVPKGIVIENKIYHHDEKEQLVRYYKHLTERKGLKPGQFHLVYLTPYKTKPSTTSIDEDLYNQLVEMKAITEWGYHKDIAPLFTELMPFIKAPVVTQTLYQYIQTIQSL